MENNSTRIITAMIVQRRLSFQRKVRPINIPTTVSLALLFQCLIGLPLAVSQDTDKPADKPQEQQLQTDETDARTQVTQEKAADADPAGNGPSVSTATAGENEQLGTDDSSDSQPQASAHQVAWLHDRASAQQIALRRNAPVLLIAGAQWCGPCRLLEAELKKANVQKELQRWVPVHIDVDTQPEDATQLAVAGIPAFRIITPSGRLVGSREGFADAKEIAGWLQDQYQQAMQDSETADWVPGKLNARQVVRILKAFRSREANIREVATTRLTSVPEIAAAPVVAQFIDSSLAERLACLDLLDAWQAPIEGLDPWIPSTITDERLKLLQDWVEKRDFGSTTDSETLDAVQTIEVRRFIRRLKTERGSSAFAIREQLARIGMAALPMIRAEINEETRPEVQDALNLARYRITASDRYLINFPGELEKLVDQNFDERIAAVDRLISMAESTEETLLLELFSDPVPLVRELALKGLTKVRGSSAGGALVQLLDDEDPNVRAAVLQQLAEQPSLILVPRISEYVETEDDPDLVVHAVRFFKAVSTVGAAQAMSKLLDHPSWRVRAEAADGLGTLLSDYDMRSLRSNSDIADKLLPLLTDEDTFVAQKAVQGLITMEVLGLDLKLMNAIDHRPEIAATIITLLSDEWSSVDGGIEKLRTLIKNSRPDIRAAAATILTTYGDTIDGAQDGALIAKALRDTDRSVRLITSQKLLQRITSEFEARLAPEPSAEDYSGMQYNPYGSSGQTTTITSEPSGLLSGIMNLFSSGDSLAEVEAIEVQAVEVEAVQVEETPSLLPQEIRGSNPSKENDVVSNWPDQLRTFIESRAIDDKIQEISESLLQDDFFAPSLAELKTLFSSEDKDEKRFAAMCLVAYGEQDAWSHILEQADERKHLATIGSLLPMIPWDKKQVLFQRLLQTAKADGEYMTVASFIASSFEQRSSNLMWELVNEDFVNEQLLGQLVQPLWQSHFSAQHYGTYNLPDDELNFLKDRAASFIDDGTSNQRVLALALLALKDPAPAVEAAAKILADETSPSDLKADAVQVSLCSLPEADAQKLAVKTLQQSDPEQSKPALMWLSMGSPALQMLRGSIYLEAAGNNSSWTISSEPQFLRPKAAPGLILAQVQPFLTSEDKTLALCAAYQAVLQGEVKHLPSILKAYEENSSNDRIMTMAYQAIAVTNANDVQSIEVLKKIYRALVQSEADIEMSEFYWTIRIMTGPEIIKFRAVIRAEQGKANLSWRRQSQDEMDDYGGY